VRRTEAALQTHNGGVGEGEDVSTTIRVNIVGRR